MPRWMIAACAIRFLSSAINAFGYIGRDGSVLLSPEYPDDILALDVAGGIALLKLKLQIPGMPITLREATLADAPLLRRWDEAPHVIASDPNDDWNWDTELARTPSWREQLIAELNGRPVGFVQIIDPAREETRYWGDVEDGLRAIDIWIGEEADLGKGYGTQMMHFTLSRCFAEQSARAVLIDPLASNVRAHRFYERIGFRFVERRRFGEDDCLVYRLDRTDYVPSPNCS